MSKDAAMPGILPHYEAFYIEAMLFSTTAALTSMNVVADVLHAIESKDVADLSDIDQHAVLDAIQNIVTHAAMLSKFFWPMRQLPSHLKRAELLKTKFGISDNNPLKSRDLRNYLEHFDEKLDNYLQDGIVGHIIPAFFGYSSNSTYEIPLHIFRAFYIDKGTFETLADTYEIQPIVDEIARLHGMLNNASTSGRL